MKGKAWATTVVAAFTGALFAAGLVVSGMTQPAKVVGFLDVFGSWDPSLAFVMAGAIAVHLVATRWILRRPAPVLENRFRLPTVTTIDFRLLAGGAIFGVGWGLAGYCPGPAVTAAAAGNVITLVFAAAMLTGMAVHDALRARAEHSGARRRR
jgi:uncharacterized protein